MVKATLRQVHGAVAIDDGVSGYYLVHENTQDAPPLAVGRNESSGVAGSISSTPDQSFVFLKAPPLAAWFFTGRAPGLGGAL